MRTCRECGKELKYKQTKYCSRICYANARRGSITVNKIIVRCEQCDKNIEDYPSQVHRFCSRGCLSTWKSIHWQGKGNPRWLNGGSVQAECLECNRKIYRSPSQVATSGLMFCSLQCSGAYLGRLKRETESTNCTWCGKEIYRKPSQQGLVDGNFCSMTCHGKWLSEHRRGEIAFNWRGGKATDPHGPGWTEGLKGIVRMRDGYICTVCKTQEGDIAHCVHHIDYDKRNHDLINLVTLCSRCHGKTGHNRRFWQTVLTSLMNRRYQNVNEYQEGGVEGTSISVS